MYRVPAKKIPTYMNVKPHSKDLYLPQERGGCNFLMGRPSLTHGRCGGLGRASEGGDPGCAAAAVSLLDWPADASS